MFFDFRIKAELSYSETAVKVGWRATFLSQALNVVVCMHTNLHTRIYPHMRIHPPDLAALFSLQWEMGNIFPGDVLLLSIRKIVFVSPGGSSDGEVSPSVQPHLSPSKYFFSPLCPSSLFPSSCISLCLSILLSLSPSICYPPWADICCQAAFLFCSSDFWLGFFRSLSFSLSWSLSPFVFYLLPSPTNSSVNNVSFLAFFFTIFVLSFSTFNSA